MSAKTFSMAGLVVFVVLGAIDFVETYALIRRDGAGIYESNPFANAWLKSYGWSGLALFKAGTMFVVATLVLIIRRYRPRSAAAVSTLSCLIVLGVALYSGWLLTNEKNPINAGSRAPTEFESDYDD